MMVAIDINSVTPSEEAGVRIVNITFIAPDGQRQTVDYCLRDDDPYGLSPYLRQRLAAAQGQPAE